MKYKFIVEDELTQSLQHLLTIKNGLTTRQLSVEEVIKHVDIAHDFIKSAVGKIGLESELYYHD